MCNRNILKIGRIYIEQEDKVRLCAPIEIPQEGKKLLFFEVEQKWGKYLVDEFSDAFVLAVLKRAMKNSWDISFETPMSEELCYQLEEYGIKILSDFIGIYHPIKLIGEITAKKIISENKVGTGFSAGVDSFYSVLKNKDTRFINHNVTHLVLARNGAALSSEPEKKARQWFEVSNEKFVSYAESLKMEYIAIWSNIPDFFWNDQCGYGDTIVTAGFIHALRKLFGVYYWASAYKADVLDFSEFSRTEDGGFIEPFTTCLVSVEGLKFYHSGSEANRAEKVAFISENEIVQKSITVCGDENAVNCGKCNKCLRTMAELYAVGKLERFKESFPVDEYMKRQKYYLAYELALDHPPFTTDIIKMMKKNGKSVGVSIYLRKWLVCKPIIRLRATFSNVYWARKLYYMFHLDEKFDKKHSGEQRKERLAKCRNKGNGKKSTK